MLLCLKHATSGINKAIWDNFRPEWRLPPLVSDTTRKEWLLNRKYALIGDDSDLDKLASTDCNIIKLKCNFQPVDFGIAFQKGFPYIKEFNELYVLFIVYILFLYIFVD